MTDTYNGWTNYETWVANLWLDQEDTYWNEQALQILSEEKNDKEDAAYTLMYVLKGHYEEFMPVIEGMYADLLGAGLSRINWYEIAKHIVDGLDVEVIDDIEE
jgi:hypothetical protein